tara:strand:+ start:940 stop:1146 length:207 start_codon:yes stop_codon:yes gene_type:complete
MKHEVFSCEDYHVRDGILIMLNATLIGRIDSISAFIKLTALVKYDAIVCPDLFTDVEGRKVNGFIFKS